MLLFFFVFLRSILGGGCFFEIFRTLVSLKTGGVIKTNVLNLENASRSCHMQSLRRQRLSFRKTTHDEKRLLNTTIFSSCNGLTFKLYSTKSWKMNPLKHVAQFCPCANRTTNWQVVVSWRCHPMPTARTSRHTRRRRAGTESASRSSRHDMRHSV